jgi:hypothetical protein
MNETHRNRVLEQVRHRVDKDAKRLPPSKRSIERSVIKIYAPGPYRLSAGPACRARVFLDVHCLKIVDSQAHGAANFGSSPETEFFNSILDFRIFFGLGPSSGILRTKIWGDSEVDVEVAGDLESCRWL